MIYLRRRDIARYYGMSAHLDTALRFLSECDLTTLRQGRNEVDGDNVYINRFDYTTQPPEETFFEAHEAYADIHVLVSGEERIAVSATADMTETARDEATDFIGYEGETQALLRMTPDTLLIAFPGEAHMVKLQSECGKSSLVEKAVVKVKV